MDAMSVWGLSATVVISFVVGFWVGYYFGERKNGEH